MRYNTQHYHKSNTEESVLNQFVKGKGFIKMKEV